MNPAVDKEDPTYVQMHSAVSQADTIKDSLTVATRNPSISNGVGTRTFTNSPITGQCLLMVCCWRYFVHDMIFSVLAYMYVVAFIFIFIVCTFYESKTLDCSKLDRIKGTVFIDYWILLH